MNIIFTFAENYFNNIKIFSFINLEKEHIYSNLMNMYHKKAVICLRKNVLEHFYITALVFNKKLFELKEKNLILLKTNVENLNNEYDLLVIISFDGLSERGKKELSSTKTKKLK